MTGSLGFDEKNVSGGSLSPFIVAAHELKSPLSLLRQLALTLEQPDLKPAQKQEIISHMKLVSERALRLTTDVTKAARLEDALFELEPLNPLQLCEDVAYELAPLYAACGRSIRVIQNTQAPLAVANRDLLRRVLLNFADNALYYGDENTPVTLSIRRMKKQEIIRVGVRDVGPALPISMWRDITSRVFAPQSIGSRPESSGLGLMVAKAFAGAMGSDIGATRHRDGATFFVDINTSHQLSLL